MYTEQQMKEYARQQRLICTREFEEKKFKMLQGGKMPLVAEIILNAPEPPLPENEQSDAESDVLTFACWTHENDWAKYGSLDRWVNTRKRTTEPLTTSELYSLFKKGEGETVNE